MLLLFENAILEIASSYAVPASKLPSDRRGTGLQSSAIKRASELGLSRGPDYSSSCEKQIRCQDKDHWCSPEIKQRDFAGWDNKQIVNISAIQDGFKCRRAILNPTWLMERQNYIIQCWGHTLHMSTIFLHGPLVIKQQQIILCTMFRQFHKTLPIKATIMWHILQEWEYLGEYEINGSY